MNSSEWLSFPSPDGRLCAWQAISPGALPVLEQLRKNSGLSGGVPERTPDFVCRIGVTDGNDSGALFKRCGVRVHPPQPDGTRELRILAPGEQAETPNIHQFRLISFQGLAPLLENGGSFWLHAALAVRNGKGILLCGPSGIGKSTAAAALAEHYEIPADDCVLLTFCRGAWHAQGVPAWKRPAGTDCSCAAVLDAVYLLERGGRGILPLAREAAAPGLGSTFTSLLSRQMKPYPAQKRREALIRALEGMRHLVRELPVRRLSFSLNTDLCAVLSSQPAD